MVQVLPINEHQIISSINIPYQPKVYAIGPYEVISSCDISYEGAAPVAETAQAVHTHVQVTFVNQEKHQPSQVIGQGHITALQSSDKEYLARFLAQHTKS